MSGLRGNQRGHEAQGDAIPDTTGDRPRLGLIGDRNEDRLVEVFVEPDDVAGPKLGQGLDRDVDCPERGGDGNLDRANLALEDLADTELPASWRRCAYHMVAASLGRSGSIEAYG